MTANLGLSWQRAKSDGAQDESKHRPISATLMPLDLAQSPDAFAFCYLLICVKTRLPSVYTNEVIGKMFVVLDIDEWTWRTWLVGL